MNRVPNPLIEDLAADLSPVRPMKLGHGIVLVGLAVIATLVAVAIWSGILFTMLAGSASPFFFIVNGMLALLGASSAYAVLRMASPRVGNSYEGARWSVAMIAILPLTAVLMLALRGALGEAMADPYGFSCFAAGLGFGVLSAGALIMWLRRGAPVALNAAGVLTGVAAGAIGSFAYGLACPLDTVGHLGIWHVMPVAVAAIAGRLIVPSLVRW